MSISCPNCGVEIVGIVIGSSPFPGWQPPPQPGANGRNPEPQSKTQSQVAHGSEASSSKGRTPYNQGYPGEFLKFWKIYPLKRDKRKACASWRNAIRRTSTDVINAGAIRYRDDPNRLPQFTKYAEGWLNGDGWEDEALPTRLNGKEPAPKTVTEDDYRRITRD